MATPTMATSGTLRGAGPLASKVSSVLSASYADSDFREALALLDQRGVQNTPEVRRQLRLDLQKEVIDSNGDIIDEFGKVAEQLGRIGRTMAKLNANFDGIMSEMGAAKSATEPVLAESSRLMTQLRQVETKQKLLEAFTATYVLSDDDMALLTLTSEPVDDRFFSVLARAKKITKDCELLLGFEKQTLGLDVMEQTCKNLNLGFQKLYRWIQREFKTLKLENPQLGTSIRRALRVLAERPTMFQNCLDLFSGAREHVLSDSFYTALTGSSAGAGQDSSVKPIELAAHDTLRYVGDMLAWTHSAAVGEREALEVLFVSDADEIAKGLHAGRENEPWRLAADEGDGDGVEWSPFNAVAALNELVDRDMAGAARILRQRVEQVIQTNEDAILAYKLANLLNFYKTTFAKLLTPSSALVETLQKPEAEALRQFRALMRDHIAALQPAFDQSLADLGLGPPEFLQDALEQLSAIMKSYDTSLTSAVDREADFQPILAEALDPFASSCETMAATVEGAARSIFLINCSLATRACLARCDFTQRRAAELSGRIDEHAARLTESQYRFFRAESGLDGLIDALAPLREREEDAAKVRGLGPVQGAALAQASQTLDDFLPSALMDAMENVQDLQDAKLARDVTEEAAERFCVDFEHVEEMLTMADELAEREEEEHEEDDGGEAEQQRLRALFPRTTGEMRVLLS